jgi:hypothetical protein
VAHDPSFDAERNLLLLGERRVVFHCHHYNVFLQRSIEDMFGEGAVEMQVTAAAESAREMLSRVFTGAASSLDARLSVAASIFGENGFGKADIAELGANGGVVLLPTSHYAVGWRAKWGRASRPVCHFAAGFWAGALVAAEGLAPERVVAVEERCMASGAPECRIRVEVR